MYFVRRFLCIFLLLLLPLHSFAVQGGWFSPASAFDVAHEVDHLARKSHHHHDDGSSHYDDSAKSAKHFSEHSASQQSATLPSAVMPQLTITPFTVVMSEFEQYIPDPIPERPQRPPETLG